MNTFHSLSYTFWLARSEALRHMTRMEKVGLTWKEETVTDLILSSVGGSVAVYPFSRNEEGGANGTGADWLWWWIDSDGTAFGMLVQAKRLKKRNTKKAEWDIDFTYKSSVQRSQLLDTAKKLQVAAAYVLYFGSPDYTADIEPSDDDPHRNHSMPAGARNTCWECKRKTVAFLSAAVARDYTGRDAAQAYVRSAPIEDLARPALSFKAPLLVPNVPVSAKLKTFIQHQQLGSKHVAQSFLAQTLDQRFGQYSLAAATEVESSPDNEVTDALFFESLPDDRNHSGDEYFKEVLRGLRTAPPAYVLNLLNGEFSDLNDELRLGREEGSGIAGVVVVHVDGPEGIERRKSSHIPPRFVSDGRLYEAEVTSALRQQGFDAISTSLHPLSPDVSFQMNAQNVFVETKLQVLGMRALEQAVTQVRRTLEHSDNDLAFIITLSLNLEKNFPSSLSADSIYLIEWDPSMGSHELKRLIQEQLRQGRTTTL